MSKPVKTEAELVAMARAELKAHLDCPDGITIAVEDRGPGVPDELKAELFEKFGSVEARAGGRRQGFGLGLHLVKLVMEAHGGTVLVTDREGGGARFELRFPRG